MYYLCIVLAVKDMFERVKVLEMKVLQLESVSPEYFDVIVSNLLYIL
jgi:hypothetical protein